MAQHTLSVLVENSPGVLARVAGLFSRRGYNIDSLAVGPTEDPRVSRMTIVLNLEGHALDQVSAQLFKLVNVIGIQEMKESETRQRELAFVKVAADRAQLEPLLTGYQAEIVETKSGTSILQVVANNKDLVALLQRLESFGIKELVQSGAIAIDLSGQTLVEQTALETGLASSDTQSQLEDYQN
ncbi:MAG: acetolactate synthase small subunit [Actinomycetales bacterium]|jgi:acetolactate synthase-1/3 small subunit